MAPISKNQVNSVYQAPLGQPTGHRTSTVAIVILLVIAIIVAVLGFGRIKNIKEEETKLRNKQNAEMQAAYNRLRVQQENQKRDASIISELENINANASSSTEDIATIEAAF